MQLFFAPSQRAPTTSHTYTSQCHACCSACCVCVQLSWSQLGCSLPRYVKGDGARLNIPHTHTDTHTHRHTHTHTDTHRHTHHRHRHTHRNKRACTLCAQTQQARSKRAKLKDRREKMLQQRLAKIQQRKRKSECSPCRSLKQCSRQGNKIWEGRGEGVVCKRADSHRHRHRHTYTQTRLSSCSFFSACPLFTLGARRRWGCQKRRIRHQCGSQHITSANSTQQQQQQQRRRRHCSWRQQQRRQRTAQQGQ